MSLADRKVFFRPAMSRRILITTWVATAMIMAGMALPFFLFSGSVLLLLFAVFNAILLGSVLGGAAAMRPTSFEVTKDSIVIRRVFPRDIRIPNEAVRVCRALEEEEKRRIRRVFGIGGLFGLFGDFRSPALGSFLYCSTNPEHDVLIVADRNYVVAPDEPGEFIKSVSRVAPPPEPT